MQVQKVQKVERKTHLYALPCQGTFILICTESVGPIGKQQGYLGKQTSYEPCFPGVYIQTGPTDQQAHKQKNAIRKSRTVHMAGYGNMQESAVV